MGHFQGQLQALLQRVIMMGLQTQAMIEKAVDGMVQRKPQLFADVFAAEHQVNAMQLEIDDLAVTLTALHQPVARDARFLFMASRIAGELERMADQAVNICQNAHHLHDASAPATRTPTTEIASLPIMAEVAQAMVRDSLTAMLEQDPALADRVLAEDEKVDALRDQMFRALLECIMADPSITQWALSMILIARNIERIGDHATNIGEEVIYWIQGRDVRHARGIDNANQGQAQ